MNTKAKMIIASLASALATLIVPLLLGAFTVSDYYTGGANPMVDAPIRSAGMLFILIPIIYLTLVVAIFLLTWILRESHLLSKKSPALIVVALSIALGLFLGLQSPFGVKDQFIGIGVFISVFIACLGPGAIVWWIIAKPGHNGTQPTECSGG